MHRRRDHLGRFLPCDNQEEPFNDFQPKLVEPQGESNEDDPFENPFANIDIESEELLHLNELLDEPEYQDNPLAIVIYQAPPLPPRMVAPTFPFSYLTSAREPKFEKHTYCCTSKILWPYYRRP